MDVRHRAQKTDAADHAGVGANAGARDALHVVKLIACVLLAGHVLAQSRPPVVSSVELLVPVVPVATLIDGRATVAYELHITNLQPVDVALERVEIVDAAAGELLAGYDRSALTARLGRPGLARPYLAPDVIGPGMRAVIYMWLELPAGSGAPRAVRHRVGLEIRRATGPVRLTVESAVIATSTNAPLVLDSPVRGGPWAAIYDPLLMGGHRTAIYTVDGYARIPARFAIDWIRLPPSGAMESKTGPRSPDWNGYGDDVLAVADATVAAALDDMPENPDPPMANAPPLSPENGSGNYIALDMGNRRFAFYEHLKHGSLVVKAGDRVKRGQVIARLGYSGSSSIGPHLHFHVADGPTTLGAEGLPFVFRQFEVVGRFPSIEAVHAGETFAPVTTAPSSVRRLERPAPNAVVRFR